MILKLKVGMKHKKDLLHRLFGQAITFMIVPHNESRPLRLRIPVAISVVVAAGLISMLTYSVLVLKENVDYRKAQESVKDLKEKAIIINEENNRSQQIVRKFKEEEKKLREMLGLKNKKAIIENSGIGGPTNRDQNRLDNILNADIDKEDIKKSMQNLQADIVEQMESFEEVKKYISTLTSVWTATPKGKPVQGYLSSKYGYRRMVFDYQTAGVDSGEKNDWHAGVDIANREGTAIKATAPGKVIFAGKWGGYGQLVILEHGYGFSTRYGHCSKILVKKGDKVKENDTIALIGMTGNTTGPHVHYEVRRYGNTIDPAGLDRDFYAKR